MSYELVIENNPIFQLDQDPYIVEFCSSLKDWILERVMTFN